MILQKGLTALREKLETVYEDEQEAYDNIPEGLLNSERGKRCASIYAKWKTALETS